jgi:hypothetical protein
VQPGSKPGPAGIVLAGRAFLLLVGALVSPGL